METATTRLLTCDEVADLFGVSQATVQRWTRTGILPSFRIGRKYRRYDAREIERLIAQGRPLDYSPRVVAR